tara:strand:+ start:540 stop:896 length:357 start_codon:yes stop_codon:yes gene_type:complete
MTDNNKKKENEDHYRDTIIKLLKLAGIAFLIILMMAGCYNSAMMRATGESRQTCQADSDCPADQMCVFNVSASSALGECIDDANYDPWKNRKLEDFIKLKEKKDKGENKQWKDLQQEK